MAYGEKYRFTWQSSGGAARMIKVLQDGFSGTVSHRPMGQAPVLRREKSGSVLGTSLEFYPECAVDQEFSEFYTSDPLEYRVELYSGSALVWSGHITPELYSEPDVAPPYDVDVIATDGIGELKLEEFSAAGRVSLLSHFQTLLTPTTFTEIYGITGLARTGVAAGDLLADTYVNLDYMAGETKYDTLCHLLDTLHCFITRHVSGTEDGWMLIREPDLASAVDGSGNLVYADLSDGSALSDASGVMSYGSMQSSPVWPVGRMVTKIEPAKKRVTVGAPWRAHNALVNPDMLTDSGWTKSSSPSPAPVYDSANHAYYLNSTGTVVGYISQDIDLSRTGIDRALRLEVKVSRNPATLRAATTCLLKAEFIETLTQNSVYLHKDEDGNYVWTSGNYEALSVQVSTESADGSAAQTVELPVPRYSIEAQSLPFSPRGVLRVTIMSCTGLMIYHAGLTCESGKGWTDDIRISNSARGDGESTEIAFGRVDYSLSVSVIPDFLEGIATEQGGGIVSSAWSDTHFTGPLDFLAIASRGRALAVAAPRIRTTGKLSVMDQSAPFTPHRYLLRQVYAGPDFNNDYNGDFLIVSRGQSFYSLIEEFTWDLLEDEVEVEALSMPAASLTVTSESIKTM